METVGNYLKGKREAKNMSLRDASRLTCIAEYYLGYIEKDEFDKLPQGPYIKGYITLYSEMIGTDVDKVLDLYDASNMQGKQIDDFRLKRPQQEVPTVPPFKMGNTDQDTSIADAPATPTDQAAPLAQAPTAPLFKFDAIALRRKGAEKATRAAAYLAASLSKGRQRLDKVLEHIKAYLMASLSKGRQWRDVAVASSLAKVAVVRPKAKGWLEAVGASVKTNAKVVLPRAKVWLDGIIALLKNLRRPRAWLYLFISLLGACILVLAGFGFYHLFIYQKAPISSGPLTQSQADLSKSPLVMETEKPPVPSQAATTPPDGSQTKANKEIDPVGRKPLSTEGRPSSSNDSRMDAGAKAAVTGNPSTPAASALNVKVVKASVCKGVQGKMPFGVGNVFSNSVKRVYVWNQVETSVVPNQIRHIYYFNDQAVSNVVLDVGSANWRTWSYVTTSGDRHQGEWRVDITSADGKVLRRLYFKID